MPAVQNNGALRIHEGSGLLEDAGEIGAVSAVDFDPGDFLVDPLDGLEKELADVGDGGGLAGGDAAAGDQLDELAEGVVDGGYRAEIVERADELWGEVLFLRLLLFNPAGVIGAEGRVIQSDKHAAAFAFRISVLATGLGSVG